MPKKTLLKPDFARLGSRNAGMLCVANFNSAKRSQLKNVVFFSLSPSMHAFVGLSCANKTIKHKQINSLF